MDKIVLSNLLLLMLFSCNSKNVLEKQSEDWYDEYLNDTVVSVGTEKDAVRVNLKVSCFFDGIVCHKLLIYYRYLVYKGSFCRDDVVFSVQCSDNSVYNFINHSPVIVVGLDTLNKKVYQWNEKQSYSFCDMFDARILLFSDGSLRVVKENKVFHYLLD